MAELLAIACYIIIAPTIFHNIVKSREQAEKWYVFSVCIVFTLLTGLRDFSVGPDTLNYKNSFDMVKNTSWGALIHEILDYIGLGSSIFDNYSQRDPGFALIMKLSQIFSKNYRFFLFVMGMIVNIPLAFFIINYSSYKMISLLTYFTLYFSFWGTTGYRQTVAYVLAILVGYRFIREQKLISFLFVVFIGFFIHKTILVVVPFYFLANKKITKKYICVIFCILVTLFIMRNQFSLLMKMLSGYGTAYGTYEGAGTWTFTFMLILVLVVSLFFRKQLVGGNPASIHYINALILACIFDPLTFINPSAIRVVYYFSFYLVLLFPEMLSILSNNSKEIGKNLIVLILLLLFVKAGQTYSFFWS